MAKDIKRHFSNLKSSGGTAPAAADLVYGEIAVGYKKGAEALYIKNHSGTVVTFKTSDNYYTKSDLTGSSTSIVVAKAASATTAGSVAWGNVSSKPTTLSGYGITDAYTKNDSDGLYLERKGFNENIQNRATSESHYNLNSLTECGEYVITNNANSEYFDNRPVDTKTAFRIEVRHSRNSANYLVQRYYISQYVYERRTTDGGASWGNWYLVQDNLADYSLTSHTHSYLPLSGGTCTGNISIVRTTDDTSLSVNNTKGTSKAIYLLASTSRGLYIQDKTWLINTDGTDTYLNMGNLGVGTPTAPSYRLHVSGTTGIENVLYVDEICSKNTSGMLAYKPTAWSYVSSEQWGLGANNCQGVIRSTDSDLVHVRNGSNFNILDSSNSSVSLSGQKLTVKINGTSKSLTNTQYSAGAGLRLTGTTFVSNTVRVTKDSKAFSGANTWIMEEYTAGSNYNLPSNAWYHIMSSQGSDTAYGTQLALGMTTAAAYYREYNNSSWGAWKSILYDSTKLPLTGGTMTGVLNCTSGMTVTGRPYGSGDDEGIVIGRAVNNYAGVTLGNPSGLHTTFYLNSSDEAEWLWCGAAGGTKYHIYHPKQTGTICIKVKVNGTTFSADRDGLVDLGTISGGGGGTGAYVPLSGGTMTGKLQVNNLITAYNYTNSNDAAAIKLDKPGSNWTGIGAHAISDTIFFSACNGDGDWVTSYQQKWLFNGDVTANGGVTSLSDKRHKKIIDNTNITVNDIASMSSVLFKWNDGRNDNSVHVGSIAQDWENVLPQVVTKSTDEEGTLSLNYGVAALVSSITTARKVVDHENEIKALKTKINVLEEKISELEK